MSKHEVIKNNVMDIDAMSSSDWSSINPEYVTRMRKQNRFKTGLDIAKYTALLCVKIWKTMMKIHQNIHSP